MQITHKYRFLAGLFLLLAFLILSCRNEQKDSGSESDAYESEPKRKIQVFDNGESEIVLEDLSLFDEKYQLKIVKYKHAKQTDPAKEYLDSVRVTLTKDSEQIFTQRVEVATFLDSLHKWEYRQPIITDLTYTAVRSNRLYFETSIDDLKRQRSTKLRFGIFYQTKKLGRLDYWKETEIGSLGNERPTGAL